jgi:hypothetical protein
MKMQNVSHKILAAANVGRVGTSILWGLFLLCWLVPLGVAYPSGLASAGVAADAKTRLELRHRPHSADVPEVIRVALYVTDLSAVNEADEYFQIQGYLAMEWVDERLALAGVDPGVREYREGEIWTPNMELANAIKYTRHSYILQADHRGLVHYSERFDANLSDDYSLREFPFDQQVLEILLEPFLAGDMSITFAPEDLGSDYSREPYAGMSAWKLRAMRYVPIVDAAYGVQSEIPLARFDIVVARRSGFYIWKVFLPMIVMALIPFSVFWVEVEQFDWQMKIPIAILLALIAFEFAVSRDLPRVPYVTFLDAVFLTCFIFVFVSVAEIVTVYAILKSSRPRLAQAIHWHARWAVPLAYVSTLLVLIPIFFHGGPEL